MGFICEFLENDACSISIPCWLKTVQYFDSSWGQVLIEKRVL